MKPIPLACSFAAAATLATQSFLVFCALSTSAPVTASTITAGGTYGGLNFSLLQPRGEILSGLPTFNNALGNLQSARVDVSFTEFISGVQSVSHPTAVGTGFSTWNKVFSFDTSGFQGGNLVVPSGQLLSCINPAGCAQINSRPFAFQAPQTVQGSTSGAGPFPLSMIGGQIPLSFSDSVTPLAGILEQATSTVELTVNATFDFEKMPESVRDFHRKRSIELAALSKRIEQITCAYDITECGILAVLKDPEFKTLVALVLTVGLIALLFTGNLAGIAMVALAIVGSFASYMASTHKTLADDPPDPNFTEFVKYSNENYSIVGFGQQVDDYFSRLLMAQNKAGEALTNALTSLERYEGALLAGDSAMALQQYNAFVGFEKDIAPFQVAAADLILGLPELLSDLGIEDRYFNANGLAAMKTSIDMNGLPEDLLFLLESAGFPAFDESLAANHILAITSDGVPEGASLYATFRSLGSAMGGRPQSVSEPDTLSILALALTLLAFLRWKSITLRAASMNGTRVPG